MTKIYIDENFAPQLANGLDVFQKHLNQNEKYKVEDLRGSELTLYKKLFRADIKNQFKND